MTVPTVAIACQVCSQDGEPIPGAVITAKLDQTEYYDGIVVPEITSVTADEDGLATLNLWPNELGALSSSYTVRVTNPATGRRVLNARGVVPNQATTLEYILQAGLYQTTQEIGNIFTFPVSIARGGTGSTNAEDALNALGLGIPVPVESGGTGQTTLSIFALLDAANAFSKAQRTASVLLEGTDSFAWVGNASNTFHFAMAEDATLENPSGTLGGPGSYFSFLVHVDSVSDLTLTLGTAFKTADDLPLPPLTAGKLHLVSCIRSPFSTDILAVLTSNFTAAED